MSEKSINEIEKKDIEDLFASFHEGFQYVNENKNGNDHMVSEQEWNQHICLYREKIGALYAKNTTLMREVYKTLEAHIHEIPANICEVIYDCTYKMFYDNEENPTILLQMTSLIIPYFESVNDMEKLVFCYNAQGYSYLEMSRTGDKEAAKQAVYWYRKSVSCKAATRTFKNNRTKCLIIVAYCNLILTCYVLGHISFPEVLELWQEFLAYYEDYQLVDYEQEMPRIKEVHDFIISRFSAEVYSFYHECIKDVEPSKLMNIRYHSQQIEYDLKLDERLWNTTNEELSAIVEDADHPLHNSAEMFCEYVKAYVYRGLLNPTEAWEKMYQFTRANIYDHGVLSSTLADPVGSICNPIEMMTQLLPQCDFSEDKKAAICEEFCDILLDFGRKYWKHSYTVNGAMKEYFFETPLLRIVKDPARKQARMMDLVISRQFVTYLHSKMVAMLAQLLLESVFTYNPEFLIGLLDTATVEDVLQKSQEMKALTEKAALLHDVGKNSIIDIITTEHRTISDYEFMLIKNHPRFGVDCLQVDDYFSDVVDVVYGHHKFYDGTGGYPSEFSNVDSKSKPLIDLITICDCIDAATDNIGRNYHRVKTYDQLLTEFQEGAGTRYHPGFVELMATDQKLRDEMTELITTRRLHIGYEVFCDFIKERNL